MATGFSAVKSGIVMFVIPFVFAMYPEVLLIEAAVLDPAAGAAGGAGYLPGYDGTLDWAALGLFLLRLALMLYLLSSALAGVDGHRLGWAGIAARLVLAALLLSGVPAVHWPAFAAALLLVGVPKYLGRGRGAGA